jgi:hypothetical protein
MWVKTINLILYRQQYLFGGEIYIGTLDYFMNDKHIKDRDCVVNVSKDMYFGV